MEAPKRRGRPPLETKKETPRFKVTQIGEPTEKKVLTLESWLDFFGTFDCDRLKAASAEFEESVDLRIQYPHFKPWTEHDKHQLSLMIEAITILAKQKGCLVE